MQLRTKFGTLQITIEFYRKMWQNRVITKKEAVMKKLKDLILKLYNMTSLRYIASSGIAFIIDYVLHLAFDNAFSSFALSLEIAAVIAWIFSSQTNFWLNRLWVFRSEKAFLPELGGYYTLAGFSFVIKTFVLLEIMCRVLKIPLFVAKPIGEVVMFTFNYLVQKKIIFKKKK